MKRSNAKPDFYCLVAGSRSFQDYQTLKHVLDYLLQNVAKTKNITIIEGEARGTDQMAKAYALEHGYAVIAFPAEWELHGKSAGFLRNERMHAFLQTKPNRGCVCFWDGKSVGTKHNFGLAATGNTPLKVYNFETGRFLNLQP